MDIITFKHKGNFKKTEKFLKKNQDLDFYKILDEYGRLGVQALSQNTPIDSGETATSWSYAVEKTKTGFRILFNNSNTNKGVNIAILIQYGHGTGTGGYIEGIDYINPAIRPIFEKIADLAWEEVIRK